MEKYDISFVDNGTKYRLRINVFDEDTIAVVEVVREISRTGSSSIPKETVLVNKLERMLDENKK